MFFIALLGASLLFGVSLYGSLYALGYRSKINQLRSSAKQSANDINRLVRPCIETSAVFHKPLITLPPNSSSMKFTATTHPSPISTNISRPKKTGGIDPLDSVPYIADSIESFMAVSDNFVNALSDLANRHFESGLELSAYVRGLHENSSGLGWLFTKIPEGTVHSLQGHLGEHIVASALTDAGNVVHFPANGFEPGWDLDLNGQKVQIKTVKYFSAVLHHQERYPEIPTIVNGDASGIPESVRHIDLNNVDSLTDLTLHPGEAIAIDGLSHETAHSAAEQGLTGSDGTGGHFHIPWITICRSSLREIALLSDGVTDLKTSIKHVLLDSAGTGGGALAGLKAGAAAGSIGGPGGAVIGGIVGSIGGALIGRKITNSIKYEPAQTATYEFETATKELPSKINSLVSEARNKFQKHHDSATAEFRSVQEMARNEYELAKRKITESKKALETEFTEHLATTGSAFCKNALTELVRPKLLSPTLLGSYHATKNFLATHLNHIYDHHGNLGQLIETSAAIGAERETLAARINEYLTLTTSYDSQLASRTQSLGQSVITTSVRLATKLNDTAENIRNQTTTSITRAVRKAASKASKAGAEWKKLGAKEQANQIDKIRQGLLEIANNVSSTITDSGEESERRAA